MAYTKKEWVNVPDPSTYEGDLNSLPRFDADNMNRIEAGIKALDSHGLGEETPAFLTDIINMMPKGNGFYSTGNSNDSPKGTDAWLGILQLVRTKTEGKETGSQLVFHDFTPDNPQMWLRTIKSGKIGDWVEMLHSENLFKYTKDLRWQTLGSASYSFDNIVQGINYDRNNDRFKQHITIPVDTMALDEYNEFRYVIKKGLTYSCVAECRTDDYDGGTSLDLDFLIAGNTDSNVLFHIAPGGNYYISVPRKGFGQVEFNYTLQNDIVLNTSNIRAVNEKFFVGGGTGNYLNRTTLHDVYITSEGINSGYHSNSVELTSSVSFTIELQGRR